MQVRGFKMPIINILNGFTRFKLPILISLAAAISVNLDVHACSCVSNPQTGFIHPNGALPSNARGVLFRVAQTNRVIRGQASMMILDRAPKLLSAASFAIRQDGSSQNIPALIEQVKAQPFQNEEKGQRFFYTKDKILQACLELRDAAACSAAKVNEEKSDWLLGLVKAGKLIDVTKEANLDGGLYRVMPLGGFVQGKHYEIRSGADVASVDIDPPLDMKDTNKFSVGLLDQAQRRFISVPRGGICDATVAATTQVLRYLLPAHYEKYRDSLVYFTERKYSKEEGIAFGSKPNEYLPWVYRSSMCSQVPIGSSELGQGKELIYTKCESGRKPLPPTFVRGRIGFLEMADTFYQTAEVKIDFNQAKSGSCSYEDAFLQAVKNKDAKEISERTCQFDATTANIDPKVIYTVFLTMRDLMHSDSKPTRACAMTSAVQLYERMAAMHIKPEPNMSVKEALKQGLNFFRLHIETSDTEILVQEIEAGLIDKDPEVKARAKDALERMLVSLTQGAPLLGSATRDDYPITQLTLNILKKILGKKENGAEYYPSAFFAVSNLGERANALLPLLLSKLDDPATYGLGLDSALAAAAPNDPRVFDAIVKILKSGESFSAAERLLQLGKGKEPAVVEALLASIQLHESSSGSVIPVLGSMGKDARSATTVLYKLVNSTNDESIRRAALDALITIDEDSQRVVKAICDAIIRPQADDTAQRVYISNRSELILLLAKLEKNGQPAIPALKLLMESPLRVDEKRALERAIYSFQLSDKELKPLLLSLRKAMVKPESK